MQKITIKVVIVFKWHCNHRATASIYNIGIEKEIALTDYENEDVTGYKLVCENINELNNNLKKC